MIYLKSHRDQKNRPYATKAIQAGYHILEIDLQMAGGEIVLGHNWRPKFKCLFDCTLIEYMDAAVYAAGNKPLIIQLDIKEICLTPWGKKRFANKIYETMVNYTNKNITLLVSANPGFGRPETMEYVKAHLIGCTFGVQGWYEFAEGKNIIAYDLWKK